MEGKGLNVGRVKVCRVMYRGNVDAYPIGEMWGCGEGNCAYLVGGGVLGKMYV